MSDSRANRARTLCLFAKFAGYPMPRSGLLLVGGGRGRGGRLGGALPGRRWSARRLLGGRRLRSRRGGRRGSLGWWRVLGRLKRVVLDLLFHPSQLGDVLLVLIVGFGEGVPAGPVGDEIEVARACRVSGGFERGAAGIGDRSGRQTVDHIGVVGGRLGNLAALDRPPQRPLASNQAIDDGRIGLQFDILPQPIDKYRCNPAAFIRPAGLLLDDGSQRHQLLG